MRITTNSKQFESQMNNIIQYSMGFLDGVENGKRVFLKNSVFLCQKEGKV